MDTSERSTVETPKQITRRRRSVVRRSEEHTSELQSQSNLVCRLLLEKKKKKLHNLSRHEKDFLKRQAENYATSHSERTTTAVAFIYQLSMQLCGLQHNPLASTVTTIT